MGVRIKRIYDQPHKTDGRRVLVDRVWPRGLTKEEAQIDEWLKDIAPSNRLRQWFGHDPARWTEFKKRYVAELEAQRERSSNSHRRPESERSHCFVAPKTLSITMLCR
jgi:uncharacterized protein YeaO (DUF488 family)